MEELKTFETLHYTRPDFEKMKGYYEELCNRVKNAKSFEELDGIIREEDEFSAHITTLTTIAYIRHTVDTSDEFYEAEDKAINNALPEVMPYSQSYQLALLSSPYKKQIDEKYGEQYLKKVKLSVDSFSKRTYRLCKEKRSFAINIKS